MNLFSFVKQQINIVHVVGQYVTLKRAGAYLKGICPFHTEKTGSFTVSPDKGIFYCFGCHLTGDVIAFIEKAERCSALEAVQFLIDRYSITVPDHVASMGLNEQKTDHQEKTRFHQLCGLSAQLFHEALLRSPEVMRYLSQRAMSRAQIEQFAIGYFPAKNFIKTFIKAVHAQSFLIDELIAAGIVQESKGTLYSPFENRIIFPIADHLGRICGFGGRIYEQADERVKYYNSRENEYFTKGSLLFGLQVAKTAMQKKNSAFLVEGYMDCISMVEHGYTNTVASLGTACTLEQLRLLNRYVNTVYVMYDGDSAGRQAMLRLAGLCWQVDLDLKIVRLPQGEDPASLVCKHKNIDAYIEQACDIFIYFLQTVSEDFPLKSIKEKVEAIRKFLTVISQIDDTLKKELLLQQAAEHFAIPLQTLQQELRKGNFKKEFQEENNNADFSGQIKQTLLEQLSLVSTLEKKIFSVIIDKKNVIDEDDALFLQSYLSQPLKNIYAKIGSLTVDQACTVQDLVKVLDLEEQIVVNRILIEYSDVVTGPEVQELIMQFQKKQWKTIVAQTKAQLQLATSAGNSEEVKVLVDRFQQLHKSLIRKRLI